MSSNSDPPSDEDTHIGSEGSHSSPSKLKPSLSSVSLTRFRSSSELDDLETWSLQRKTVAAIIGQKSFEMLFGVLVLLSLALAVIDTDRKARGALPPSWVPPLESILLGLYVVEVSMRIFVFRLKYWLSLQNICDFLIVFIDAVFFLLGLASVKLPQVAFLRVLRLLKLTRTLHFLNSQPELYILVRSFFGSLKATIFCCVFIMLALVLFGIIAVECMHPLPIEFSAMCVSCPEAFNSVYYAMLTLFETVVVGDMWGELFLPFLKAYPTTLLYIIPVYVVVHFSLINLMMAVIVDAAHRARKHNDREVVQEKAKELENQKKKLQRICRTMDSNDSGCISLDELKVGFDENVDFKHCLLAMDINDEDLTAVFNILDQDGSGDVEYDEFVDQLYRMKNSEAHTMRVFVKHHVMDARKQIFHELIAMNEKITGGIEVLQKHMTDELRLIRGDIAKHLSEPIAIGKRFETNIDAECKVLSTDEKLGYAEDIKSFSPKDLYQSSPITSVPLFNTGAPINDDHLVIDCQLHVALEQMNVALDELKAKCENSSALIATFKDMHSRTATCETSILGNATEGLLQPILKFSIQDGSGPLWQSKLARTQRQIQCIK